MLERKINLETFSANLGHTPTASMTAILVIRILCRYTLYDSLLFTMTALAQSRLVFPSAFVLARRLVHRDIWG